MILLPLTFILIYGSSKAKVDKKADEEHSVLYLVAVGAGAVALIISFIACTTCTTCTTCITCTTFKCVTKKSGGKVKPGDYGRASIDSNFQYNCKEYYQYQNTKKQTHVVDENDLYKNYDYE